MSYAIETTALSKHYGDVIAVNNLSLSVQRGVIYAFLGRNGAGKTTTIRLLLGMVKPTAGNVRLFGTRVHARSNSIWSDVGHLVETPHAYPELTVRENLDLFRRLRPGTSKKAVTDIVDRLELTPFVHRRARTLSHGNAQRLGLARALLHEPELLVLDEPSNGLDPAGIVAIRSLFLSLAREKGVTIFLSSHILAEVSRLADRIGFIHEGRLVQELDAADVQRLRQRRLVVDTTDNKAALEVLRRSGYEVRTSETDPLLLESERAIEHPEQVAEELVNHGCPPKMLRVETEDLEDYFLRLVGANPSGPS